MMKIIIGSFILFFVLVIPCNATDVTVCDIGCDYTSVTDAMNALPINGEHKITTTTDVILLKPFGVNRSMAFSKKPLPSVDTTPDAFAFIPQIGISPNYIVISTTVVITGINSPTPISVVNGLYSINGKAFTNVPSKISNGDSVRVKRAASSVGGKTLTATLTIGGVSGVFSVTTK